MILPWNFKGEIVAQLDHIRGWGGRFIVPIPSRRCSEMLELDSPAHDPSRPLRIPSLGALP
jgi:hypothetical protein